MKSMKLVLIFTNPVLIQPSVGFFYHEASVSSFSPWRHRYVIYPERWGSNGPGIPGIPGIPGMDKKITNTVKTIRVVEVRLNELQFLNSR